jgi:hypothetical protein
MVRLALSLITFSVVSAAQDKPEAPAIEFRELTWWAPSICGTYGWWPGKDVEVYATSLGRRGFLVRV